MKKGRYSWFLVSALVVTLLAVACQSASPPAPSAKEVQASPPKVTKEAEKPKPQAAEPTRTQAKETEKTGAAPAPLQKLTVVQIFNSGALGPYWVAKDEGIFKKYGIEVETVFINGPQPAVAALNSGQADALLTAPSPPTLSGAAQGLDIALVLTFSNKLSYFLVARPEFKGLQDLKGKKLAVNRINDSDYQLARNALAKLGVSPDDVQYLAVGNMPERVAALVQGMVDATTLSPPMDLTARKQGMVQLSDMGELGLPYIATSLHIRRTLAKEKPQVVENVVKALTEGIYVFRTNKEIGIKAISKNMKLNDQQVLEYTWEAVSKKLEKVPSPSLEGLREVIKLNVPENPKLEGLPVEKVIDTSFVKKIEDSGFIDKLYGSK
ncbi:MAG: ABC transporter substrate-binding protein [Actinobacteria bacterium]|nr:ABC transporter substrate-binding protein [Actinomycetota bacterium]